MANPQVEDGFIRIAKEIARALMKTDLSSYQQRFLWALWDKTYGWQKKEDWISNRQIVRMTGIRPSHIARTKKELIERTIVTKRGNKMAFNKDYTQWRQLPKGVRTHSVTNRGSFVTKRGIKSYQKGGTQKKEDIQKNIRVGCVFSIYDFYCQTMGKNPKQYKLTAAKKSKIKSRLKDCSVREIHDAILACRASSFHMGENDNGRPYNDLLKNIIPNREKVEQWNERKSESKYLN